MINPKTNHVKKRIHVNSGKLIIKYNENPALTSGVIGTPGHLNFLSTSGIVRRNTMIPTETKKNANNVPILHNSIKALIDNTPANTAVAAPVMTVQI